MPQSPKELERIGEEASEKDDERFELEDTAIEKTPSELQGGGPIALQSALNMDMDMDVSELYTNTTTTGSTSEVSTRCDTLNWPLPDKPLLPLSSPEVWWGSNTLAARRRKNRISFRSITLTKPLASMGDSFNWKLSVLHRINAVKYPL